MVIIDGKEYKNSPHELTFAMQVQSNPHMGDETLAELMCKPKYNVVQTMVHTLPNGIHFCVYLSENNEMVFYRWCGKDEKLIVGTEITVKSIEFRD